MEEIASGIYVETGFGGCNTGFVVTSEGIVMIDAPLRPLDAIQWKKEISTRGEVRYLINTEPHKDHYATNSFFPGTVIAHKGTAEGMKARPLSEIIEQLRRSNDEGWRLLEVQGIKFPAITFTQELEIHLGYHTFRLIHLPGHSDSETAVFVPQERVIFTSDNVVYKTKNYLHAAVPEKWLDSLQRIGELDVEIIVPGHGKEMCNKSYISQQAAIIQDWVEVVKAAIQKGWSKEEALARISCPDPYPLPKGREAFAAEVDRNSINRLYDLFTSKEK